MKKVLGILLAVLLVAAVAVGCGAQKTTSDALKDGEYTASDEQFDDHGWKGEIKITVKDGKITAVDYNEVNKDGVGKQDDEAYNKNMKEKKGTDNTPKVAFPILEKALVEKQDPDKVDAVSGCTSSSNSFKALAKKALGK